MSEHEGPLRRQVARPVLVAGGSGFVGHRLVVALDALGHEVRVMTRHPDRYQGPGVAVYGDVDRPETLADALAGVGAAYYLVHALESEDFADRDARAATAFGEAAGAAGAEQIVYLGGLGDDRDDLSPHLRSRRDVERLLGAGGVPVTVLRAGIVIGHGGLSWEITRQLVEHLPAMVTPRWVRTRTQPIAVDDMVRYLVGVLDNPAALGRIFEVGGPDVLEYRQMLGRVAEIEGRSLPILPVPLLSPRLSARWLAFVTDVDPRAGRHLIDSMVNEAVVRDDGITEVVPFAPMGYDDAVRAALAERRAAKQDRGGRKQRLHRTMASKLASVTPMPLSHVVSVEHVDPPGVVARRKRVVAATSAVGAAALGISLSTRPGSKEFYLSTASVAGVWTAGSLLSGPLHLGWIENRDATMRRPVLVPVLTGVGAFGLFYGLALVARRIPVLDEAISDVVRFAEAGDGRLVLLTTLANGVAEELFFRGAVYAAIGDAHPVLASTGVYAVATVTTRNPALMLAAGVMGGLFGLQRRASGGIQAPTLTHLTWSALVLRFLPPLFRSSRALSPRDQAVPPG